MSGAMPPLSLCLHGVGREKFVYIFNSYPFTPATYFTNNFSKNMVGSRAYIVPLYAGQ
jgi:hypothetical protein